MSSGWREQGRLAVEEYLEASRSVHEMIGRAANLSAGEVPIPTSIDGEWMAEMTRREERLQQAQARWRNWLRDPVPEE
jgi:hypothetical protein